MSLKARLRFALGLEKPEVYERAYMKPRIFVEYITRQVKTLESELNMKFDGSLPQEEFEKILLENGFVCSTSVELIERRFYLRKHYGDAFK